MPAPASMANATPTSEQGISMVFAITDIMYLLSLFVMGTFYANTCARFFFIYLQLLGKPFSLTHLFCLFFIISGQ